MPEDSEWTILVEFLGGPLNAGNKLKSTTGWKVNNNTTNKSGFSGLPGGYRLSQGDFSSGGGTNGVWGHWWSKSLDDEYRNSSFSHSMNSSNASVGSSLYPKTSGLSVRCIKDYSKSTLSNSENSIKTSSSHNRLSEPAPNYDQLTIGKQIWMISNLNVDKFRNGDPIKQAKTSQEWLSASENGQPAWCYYDFDPDNGEKYGKLYNWYAVADSRGLAPAGWHVPKDSEWSILSDYLGGEKVAGPKMKSSNGWIDNGNGTNSSGFKGLPGGYCSDGGAFHSIGSNGAWWSSTQLSKYAARSRLLTYNKTVSLFTKEPSKGNGYSVRCIKD